MAGMTQRQALDAPNAGPWGHCTTCGALISGDDNADERHRKKHHPGQIGMRTEYRHEQEHHDHPQDPPPQD